MGGELVPLLVAGGVAYYVVDHGTPITTAPRPVAAPTPGRFPTSTIGQRIQGIGTKGTPPATPAQTTSSGGTRTQPTSGSKTRVAIALTPVGNWVRSDVVKVNTDLAKAEAKAKAAYNALSSGAKAAGAAELNKEFDLDPPLKGDESWEDLSRAAGAAIGASAGSYLGGPLGAKLGAIVGAYLGVKLEEFVSDAWDEVKDYASDAYDKVSDAASDAWDDFTDLF